MGYWGSIVVARPVDLLVRQDGIERFGYRHRWLRELGMGWQLVETNGLDDSPDLVAATVRLATSTVAPVLAAYASDGDCAMLCTSVPDGATMLAHLPDVTQPCPAYQHRPSPSGQDESRLVAELSAWAEAGGLSPSPAKLRALVGHRQQDGHRNADDLVFDLVLALGADRIGPPRAHRFDLNDLPFAAVVAGWGLGRHAHHRAGYRASLQARGMEYDPPESLGGGSGRAGPGVMGHPA